MNRRSEILNEEDAGLALDYVIKWLQKKHCWKAEVVALDAQLSNAGIEVSLLKPYGLFIIKPDGSVEDNYKFFG